ncbi:hypothetical protein TCAP_04076 [Tolypocladium capitatum]|uniref:Uncharacterized protein n=1 Tax=Tolypocladium capitatum TaxID=45235 RepID=A0A2K3QEL8_9HYPO|nr:hypothetical protein TCAP_04076 [Tolypocladium capitatum]
MTVIWAIPCSNKQNLTLVHAQCEVPRAYVLMCMAWHGLVYEVDSISVSPAAQEAIQEGRATYGTRAAAAAWRLTAVLACVVPSIQPTAARVLPGGGMASGHESARARKAKRQTATAVETADDATSTIGTRSTAYEHEYEYSVVGNKLSAMGQTAAIIRADAERRDWPWD